MAATASELRRIYSYLLGDHDHPERLPALLEEGRHRHDLVFVDAALEDGVHLHGQASRDGGVDAVEYSGDREIDVVEGAEGRIVQRVGSPTTSVPTHR